MNINESTVKNSSSICNIEGSLNTGGIVGYVKSKSIVTNCSSNTDIICESNSGGLVWRLEDISLLEHSSCKGIVNGSKKNNAGLVGVQVLQSRVNNCRSKSSFI